MLSKKCVRCGTEYFKKIHVSRKSWAKSTFCSRKCINLGNVPWNKDTKGICIPWNKGRLSPESRGQKNGAWKGTDDKYWRSMCLERDDHTCQECEFREVGIMQVDHIKPKKKFPHLRYDINNLQTLCPNCHARKTVKELKEIRNYSSNYAL